MDSKASIAQCIANGIELMQDQPILHVRMSASTYAKLLLLDVFAENEKLGDHAVEVSDDCEPDLLEWISELNPGMPAHVILLPEPEPPPIEVADHLEPALA
jgi:hypothetical protein